MKKAIKTFGKAQVAAFAGGLSDYAIMISLTEACRVPYTISIIISGFLGAIVNFSLSRKWAFNSKTAYHHSLRSQLLKFAIVISGSVLLKASGTYLVTENAGWDYKISRVVVDLLVSYSFNYPLIKYWVFKKAESEEPSAILIR